MMNALRKANENNIITPGNVVCGRNIELKLDLIIQKKKLFPLTKLEEGDKVGKINGTYYIQERGLLQQIKRWFNSESRINTFKYLNDDFIDFFKFCNKLKENMFIPIINSKDTQTGTLELINDLINGLYNLKTTYILETNEDAKKLVCKIDSIILTLIDFKDELDRRDNTISRAKNVSIASNGEELSVPSEKNTEKILSRDKVSGSW